MRTRAELFRPLLGWATAWSFDRLRRWLEGGVDPGYAANQARVHALAAVLAVDLDLSVDARGGLRLRSGDQRFYEGHIAFRFPLFFSGVTEVGEWFDDATGRFRIEVAVSNRAWGPLFGYQGSFDVEWIAAPNGPPASVRPLRNERRE